MSIKNSNDTIGDRPRDLLADGNNYMHNYYYYYYFITIAFTDLFDNDVNDSERGRNKWTLAAY